MKTITTEWDCDGDIVAFFGSAEEAAQCGVHNTREERADYIEAIADAWRKRPSDRTDRLIDRLAEIH